MRILFVDPLSPKGHINYNLNLLKPLASKYSIDTIFVKDYIKDVEGIDFNKVLEFSNNYISNNSKNIILKSKVISKIWFRIKQIYLLRKIVKIIKKSSYDYVVFSSFDLPSYVIGSFGMKSKSLVIIHNNISLLLKKKSEKFLWNKLNKNTELIVLEPFIKEYLERRMELKNPIWILRHPLPEKIKQIDNESVNLPLIFAPGGSNDQDFIDFLIENNSEIKQYKICIKSSLIAYSSKNLEVYNTRISSEEYESLLSSSSYILLPYNSNFNYRVSGVLFEAFANRKKVILKSNNTLSNYSLEHPTVFSVFKNDIDFFSLINNISSSKQAEFDELLERYSKDNIISQLEKIFK